MLGCNVDTLHYQRPADLLTFSSHCSALQGSPFTRLHRQVMIAMGCTSCIYIEGTFGNIVKACAACQRRVASQNVLSVSGASTIVAEAS